MNSFSGKSAKSLVAFEVMKSDITLKFFAATRLFAWMTLAAIPVAVTGCSSGKTRPERETLPFAGRFETHRYVLANGLKVLVIEDHASPTFSYQTCYRVGSMNEDKKYTGLAHLFEHMMFKQTKNLADGEFDRQIDQAGGENMNAFTSRDNTVYLVELPKDKLDLIARLESDRMVNLVVNEDAFRTEREVVHNERKFRYDNNPDGMIYEAIFELAYTKHPYGWPVAGYPEDLNRMKAADAEAFYRKHYRPEHATIAVVGDVDPSEVIRTITKYYGGFGKPGSQPVPIRVPKEPEQTAARQKIMPLNIPAEKLMMAYHVPGVADADVPVIEVIQGMLTQSKSSRLNQALIDTGIATEVSSGAFQYRDPSLFVVAASMQKGKKAALAEEIVLRELRKLGSSAITPAFEAELERARNVMSFGFYQSIESNMGKASFIASNECVSGDFRVGLRVQEGIQKVTALDVQRVIKKYFRENNRSVVMGVLK